jgi:uncharacterized membrane protein YesL
MNNKLLNFIQTLYLYFQVSFYFWIYLFKGFIIYALVPVTAALFLTIKDIREQKDEQAVGIIFKSYYQRYQTYRLPSFLYSFLGIVLLAALIYISRLSSKNAYMLILIIVILYILCFGAVLFTYSVHFITTRSLSFKQSLIFSFVAAIRNFVITLGLLVVMIGVIYTAYVNFAFFVIFSPFLFGLGVTLLFSRLNVN